MAFSRARIHESHYRPTPSAGWGVQFAEQIYRGLVDIRLGLYARGLLKPRRLPVPVISIGNLTTGGTGKTPVVIALAQTLEAQGLRVGVLSRGYGRTEKTDCHEADSPAYGDEPYLIQQHLQTGKVFVGSNRYACGMHAMAAFRPDVVLLDDGFQHMRLHRDLDILLVDGERGFGNGRMLPRGPLREPMPALSRAHWVLLTKTVLPQTAEALHRHVMTLPAGHRPQVGQCPFEVVGLRLPPDGPLTVTYDFPGGPVMLLSGIAQPKSFEASVRRALPQATVTTHIVLPDHFRVTDQLLAELTQALENNPGMLITTEKDWVKLDEVLPASLRGRVAVLEVAPVCDWSRFLAGLSLMPHLAEGA